MGYVVLDLYAGTGRCAEPFRAWEKVSDIFLADNSDYARAVYLANHPNSKYLKANLATMSVSKLLTEVGGRVDILLDARLAKDTATVAPERAQTHVTTMSAGSKI